MNDGASNPTTPAQGPLTPAAMRAFMAFVVLAVVVWVAIGVGSNARAPGAVGLAATIFGGVFAALLTVAVGGGIALKLNTLHGAPVTRAPVQHADPDIAVTLAELDAAQAPEMRRMIGDAAWRTPACAAAGAALWSLAVMLGVSGGVLDFSIVLMVAGLLGLAWARRRAAGRQSVVYLETGAGGLARRAAGLTWRPTAAIDFRRLQSEGVLPAAGNILSGGELAGAIQGVSVRIAPALTDKTAPASDAPGAAFSGIVIELEGVRAGGSMEALAARDPRVTVRIGQLASLPGLGAPRSVALDDRISIAVPETAKPRLFDSPARLGAVAAAPKLERVRELVRSVSAIVDVLTASKG